MRRLHLYGLQRKEMVMARIQSKGGTEALQIYEYAEHADPSKALKQVWGGLTTSNYRHYEE